MSRTAALAGGSGIRRVGVALDSFKGSLPGQFATTLVADVFREYLGDGAVQEFLLADGGEGSLDCAAALLPEMELLTVPAVDPRGNRITARLGYLGSAGQIFLEAAECDALAMVPPEYRNPLRLTSAGVGMLIRQALDLSPREIYLCLGGTATVDGGLGMLQSLGARLHTAQGPVTTPATGQTLADLTNADWSGLDPRLRHTRITCLADVTSPLTGPEGAAAVFGPQKGADPATVAILEQGMQRLAALLPEKYRDLPGGGAAGGIGYAAAAALGAEITGGSGYFLEMQHFREQLPDLDLLITGEGCIDRQSSMGKGPGLAAYMAQRCGVPVVGLCGTWGADLEPEDSVFTGIFPIVGRCCGEDEALKPEVAAENLRRTATSVARLFLAVWEN